MKSGTKWKILLVIAVVAVALNWGTIADFLKDNSNKITGSTTEDAKIVVEEERKS